MISIFVPDLREFHSLVEGAGKLPDCKVASPVAGYWRIDAAREIRFDRRALGLRVALWNSALAGGFLGRIAHYDRNEIHIVDETDGEQ